MDLSDLRHDFGRDSGKRKEYPDNAFVLFKELLEEAVAKGVSKTYAMVLSTCGADGRPSKIKRSSSRGGSLDSRQI